MLRRGKKRLNYIYVLAASQWEEFVAKPKLCHVRVSTNDTEVNERSLWQCLYFFFLFPFFLSCPRSPNVCVCLSVTLAITVLKL